MPYAIQERGFEFNDEYFELHQAVSFYKMYNDEKQARAVWVSLEREYLDDIALMRREPFAVALMNQESDPIYQRLLNKLAEFGIAVDDAVQAEMKKNYYYADNEQLQLHRLNDEQLLELLLATDCHLFCITQFETTDSSLRYVLKFYYPELSEFNFTNDGYLSTTSYDDGYWACNAEHPDALFETELFDEIEPERPLATFYSNEDESSVLLQSLLAQYEEYFDLIESEFDTGSELKSHTRLHYLGGNTQALRAVNELLTHPFFKIKQVSYDELEALKQRQDEAFEEERRARIENYNARTNQSFIWQGIKRLFGR